MEQARQYASEFIVSVLRRRLLLCPRRERKQVEMRFAHMKRILKLDRLRLRGLSGAKAARCRKFRRGSFNVANPAARNS